MRRTHIAAGVAAAIGFVSSAQADLTAVDVGTLRNSGLGTVDYEGEFGAFMAAFGVDGSTRIDVDVVGIMDSLGGGALAGVRIIDTGENQYGVNSAGADIDLLSFGGLPDGVSVDYSYAGPNGNHVNESGSVLGQRVAFIDHQSGVHEWEDLLHVSLGNQGLLTALFSTPIDGADVTPPPASALVTNAAGAGFLLSLSEAGTGESFRVELLMSLPGPGGLPLLAAALLAGRPRRRRAG